MKKERTLAEPFKIKMIEPLRMTTVEYRKKALQKAGYNPFLLSSDDVYIDLLTDSGTSAMSDRQWSAMMLGDESYAGARSWEKLEAEVKDLTGMHYVLPAHQGRAAERILYSLLGGKDKVFISNTHFDTTRANIEFTGALAIDCMDENLLNAEAELPFKGNIDIEQARATVLKYGKENIGAVILTVTNNSSGGQPVSMENARQVRALCDEFGLLFVLDGCRIAENSYFIKHREGGLENLDYRTIAQQMLSLCDAFIMSAKKDGLVNMGGLLVLRQQKLAEKCTNLLIISEGFATYGGLSGRDMEAMAVGLREVFDPDYLHYRIKSTEYLGEHLHQKGVPLSRRPERAAPCDDACTTLVIFGITGDLAPRKTFIALYELLALPDWSDIRIIGVGRSPWSDSHLRRSVGAAVRSAVGSGNVDRKRLRRLQDNLTYLHGDVARPATFARLGRLVEEDAKVLCYLAVPPPAFAPIIDGLADSQLPGVRLLVEKPFGHDSASAHRLTQQISRSFPNEAVYAVDHYLEKRGVERISELRFANRIIEGSWTSDHIDEVSITLAEDIGIEGRAGFFDEIGTLRDVVQNHAMQVLTAIAMEQPVSDHAEDLHRARLDLVRSIRPVVPGDLVRGQYEGYLEVQGVKERSSTETFVHVELTIDNERWSGTRFGITAGKALDHTATEASAHFRRSGPGSKADEGDDGNVVRFGIAPHERVTLTVQPGSVPITIQQTGEPKGRHDDLSAYARVLDDARRGDHRRFLQRDVIEATWRIFDDVLGADLPLHVYERGSAGPDLGDAGVRDAQREAETTPAS